MACFISWHDDMIVARSTTWDNKLLLETYNKILFTWEFRECTFV